MQILNNFFRTVWKTARQKRGVGFYFSLAAFASALGMLILYNQTGITTFTPILSEKVVALLGVCIALSVLFAVFEIKLGKYLLYLFCFWMWLEYLISEASYISNVFVSIDGNSFSSNFILTVVFGLLAWLLALIAAILQKAEIGSAKNAASVMAEEAEIKQ